MNKSLSTLVLAISLLGACNQAPPPAPEPSWADLLCTRADPNGFPPDAEVARVATAGNNAIVATAGSLTCTQPSAEEAACVLTGPGMVVVSDSDHRPDAWSAAAGQIADIRVDSAGGRCRLRRN